MPNKRVKFARFACPTRKSLRLLLAAYARRWAAESNMSSERNRSRYQQQKHDGANYLAASSIGAVCSSASQLRLAALAIRRMLRVAPSVVVPLLGAQLRLSAQGTCLKSRSSAPRSRIASRSQTSSSRLSVPVLSCTLPNKRLELTAQRLAPLGPRSAAAPAAQPQR
jgi:hypothetical protein